MERAVDKDLDLVMTLVNAAYAVEKGPSGLAFKASDRFMQPLPSPQTSLAQHLTLQIGSTIFANSLKTLAKHLFAAQVCVKGGCI